jgi:hypothetical protein
VKLVADALLSTLHQLTLSYKQYLCDPNMEFCDIYDTQIQRIDKLVMQIYNVLDYFQDYTNSKK